MVPKKLSMGTFSQQLPLRLLLFPGELNSDLCMDIENEVAYPADWASRLTIDIGGIRHEKVYCIQLFRSRGNGPGSPDRTSAEGSQRPHSKGCSLDSRLLITRPEVGHP
jgi:hypothetical protein